MFFKLMVREVTKGFWFVAFSMAEEATRAVNEMNGKMIGRKPPYVAMAQHRGERKARLQAHFAQINALCAMTPLKQLQPMPGIWPGVGPNIMMLYYLQRLGHLRQRMGSTREETHKRCSGNR
ncbi:hypothetical protein MKX01_040375 [Papaver californicum]|nr:hypothetical protein MKX01_040375 [Papaver californicum]